MTKNVGSMEAIIRITLGFVGLAWSTAALSKRSYPNSMAYYIAFASAMKVAEGITRFCPIKAVLSRP